MTRLIGDATSGPVAVGAYAARQTALVGQTVGKQQIEEDTVAVGGDQSPVGPGTSAALTSEKTETTAEVRSVQKEPVSSHRATCQPISGCDIRDEQERDPAVKEIKEYLTSGVLPRDQTRARRLVLQASHFSLIDGVLYHKEPKTRHKCAVAPSQLCEELLRITHAGKSFFREKTL